MRSHAPAERRRCPSSRSRWSIGTGVGRAQVDPQREDALVQRALGVADHREVLEVRLSLLHELRSLGTRDRREVPLAHRSGAVAKPLDYRVDIEPLSNERSGYWRDHTAQVAA